MKERQHPYCYPGTEVLVNAPGIRDRGELESAETLIVASRLGTLPEDHPMTPAGLKAINRHLFGLLYGWAGSYRTVTTGRGPIPFCKAEFIEAQMRKQFALLNAEGNLAGLTRDAFAARAAEHMNELNAIHPFIEGNGRALRALLTALGRQAGHRVDLALIDPGPWNAASVSGFHHSDHAPMAEVIGRAIVGREEDSRNGTSAPFRAAMRA